MLLAIFEVKTNIQTICMMVLSFWYAINFLALQDTRSFTVFAHLLAFFSSSAASALASWNSLIAWNLSGISFCLKLDTMKTCFASNWNFSVP